MCVAPSTFGGGGETRLESSIKNISTISDDALFAKTVVPGLGVL